MGTRVLPTPDAHSHAQKPSSLAAPDHRITHSGRDFSSSRRPTSFFPRDAFASLCQDTPSTAGASSPCSGMQRCGCAPSPAVRRALTAAGWRTPMHACLQPLQGSHQVSKERLRQPKEPVSRSGPWSKGPSAALSHLNGLGCSGGNHPRSELKPIASQLQPGYLGKALLVSPGPFSS